MERWSKFTNSKMMNSTIKNGAKSSVGLSPLATSTSRSETPCAAITRLGRLAQGAATYTTLTTCG